MAIPTVHTLGPAYHVIERLGGKSAVSEELGISRSALSRWCSPHPQGTGGLIPQRYWPSLIAMARTKRVRVTVQELSSVEV